jgi:ribosomal protein S27AE
MIREKALLFKLNLINIPDNELFRTFIPKKKTCPKCRARGRLKPHGSYGRDLISINNGRRGGERVRIKRAICTSCGSTHALIPDILIPHSSHTLRFIVYVIKAYLNRTGTVEELCNHYQVAISTLYRWKGLFKNHTNLLLRAFEQISQTTKEAVTFICNIEALPESFFSKYGFSFLQNQKQHTIFKDSC